MTAVSSLMARDGRARPVLLATLAMALGAHATLAMALGGARAHAAPPRPPIEVELAPPPPPPPPPPSPVPAPPAEPTPPAKESEVVAKPSHLAPRAAAPAAAKAGKLVVADAPKAQPGDEPVSFVSDPDGASFGSGVVAAGGTAAIGAANAKPAGVAHGTGSQPGPIAKGGGDAIVPASDLSRSPSLGGGDPCKGFFPTTAEADVASAAVLVVVRPSGQVSSASVIAETPKGQGFGKAARACLLGRTFSPGLDKSGKAVVTSVRVDVRFAR